MDRPLRWVINEVNPLSTWTLGRVAIMGDAVCNSLINMIQTLTHLSCL